VTPSQSIAAARPFSSSTPLLIQSAAAAPRTDSLVELAKSRRTIYQLGKNSPVPDSKIEELVNAAILNVPSAFNTQSTRLLVLLHREHERLWDVIIDVFQNLVKTGAIPEQVWQQQTLPKLEGFKAGVGTVRRSPHATLGQQMWRGTDTGRMHRSSSTKTLPISRPSRRNFLSTRINSSLGRSILMLCISISVCLAPPPLCFLFPWFLCCRLVVLPTSGWANAVLQSGLDSSPSASVQTCSTTILSLMLQ
jgi:hypothetical protein